MGFWKNLFRGSKEESALVRTMSVGYSTTNNRTSKSKDHTAFWHLHETSHGRRYVNIYPNYDESGPLTKITEESMHDWKKLVGNRTDTKALCFLFETVEWNKTIYPWLAGRRVPGIPTYDDVPKEDFKRALKEG